MRPDCKDMCQRFETKRDDCAGLALARLVAAVGLVDHIDPAAAADDTAILVAQLQRLQ